MPGGLIVGGLLFSAPLTQATDACFPPPPLPAAGRLDSQPNSMGGLKRHWGLSAQPLLAPGGRRRAGKGLPGARSCLGGGGDASSVSGQEEGRCVCPARAPEGAPQPLPFVVSDGKYQEPALRAGAGVARAMWRRWRRLECVYPPCFELMHAKPI